MNRTRLFAIPVLFLLAALVSPASAWKDSPSQRAEIEGGATVNNTCTRQDDICVTYNTEHGTVCGDPSSLKYNITNECSYKAKATVWKKNSHEGEWIEGSSYYLYPNQTASGWWCQAPYDIKITYRPWN